MARPQQPPADYVLPRPSLDLGAKYAGPGPRPKPVQAAWPNLSCGVPGRAVTAELHECQPRPARAFTFLPPTAKCPPGVLPIGARRRRSSVSAEVSSSRHAAASNVRGPAAGVPAAPASAEGEAPSTGAASRPSNSPSCQNASTQEAQPRNGARPQTPIQNSSASCFPAAAPPAPAAFPAHASTSRKRPSWFALGMEVGRQAVGNAQCGVPSAGSAEASANLQLALLGRAPISLPPRPLLASSGACPSPTSAAHSPPRTPRPTPPLSMPRARRGLPRADAALTPPFAPAASAAACAPAEDDEVEFLD